MSQVHEPVKIKTKMYIEESLLIDFFIKLYLRFAVNYDGIG